MGQVNSRPITGEEQEFLTTFARADFKPELFDQLIKQKGMTVIWEQSVLCSCIDPTRGTPKYNCSVCKGKGYIYSNPKETKAVVTSINGRKEQDKQGLNDFGSAYLTPMSTDFVGYRDRFTFPDFLVKVSQVLTMSEGKSNTPLYRIHDVMICNMGENMYNPQEVFTVEEEGKYLSTTTPELMNGRVSILYTTHPAYIALGPVHELRGTYCMKGGGGKEYFVPLPSQYQIKREDYIK